MTASFSISSSFDAGNIRVVSTDCTARVWQAELEIVPDHQSDFYQWFYFRVSGAAGQEIELILTNCAGAAYPGGWPDYKARVSEDRIHWRLADTHYADGRLTIRVAPATNALWVAYFAPYSMERHHDLVAWAAGQPGALHQELGLTLDGQPIDLLSIGEGNKQVWLYARQHPGESMAEWWVEGALACLTDPADPVARRLRQLLGFATYVCAISALGACVAGLGALARGVPLTRAESGATEWIALALLLLVPTIGGHTVFHYVVRYVRVFHVNLVILAEPVIAIVMKHVLAPWFEVFRGNALTHAHWLGGALLFGGVAIGLVLRDREEPRSAANGERTELEGAVP